MQDLPAPVPPPSEPQVVTKPGIHLSGLVATSEDLGLTNAEEQELAAFNTVTVILGPAAGSALICPGNQVDFKDEEKCPYFAKCPLLRVQKAPAGKLCPIEKNLIEERFSAWCREIERDPLNLNESDRVTVADLVWIDIQVNRCNNILSSGEAARLQHTNITEAILPKDSGSKEPIPLTFERVLHIAAERLDQLLNQRRLILREWMITPEQKYKIAKLEGNSMGNDASSQLSAKADKLRKLGAPVIDG